MWTRKQAAVIAPNEMLMRSNVGEALIRSNKYALIVRPMEPERSAARDGQSDQNWPKATFSLASPNCKDMDSCFVRTSPELNWV